MKSKKILRFNICELAEEVASTKLEIEESANTLAAIENELGEHEAGEKMQDHVSRKLSLLLKRQLHIDSMHKLDYRLTELERKTHTLEILDGALRRFPDLIRKTYPQAYNSQAITACVTDNSALPFQYTEEYVDYLFDILLRCWYSTAPNKVYDSIDRNYYDSDKMGRLLDHYAFPGGDWFEQLLYTLYTGEQAEWSELLRMTENRHMDLVSALLEQLQGFVTNLQQAA